MVKQTTPVVKTVDKKRSLAAKKGAVTRARNRELALTQGLKLRHRAVRVVLIAVVIAFAAKGIVSQFTTYAASSASSVYTITGLAGMCLTNRQAILENRNPLEVYPCITSDAQRWTLGSNGSIKNLSGNFCVDVPGASKMSGIRLWLYQCNKTVAQSFAFKNGTIVNTHTGFCVGEVNNSSIEHTRLAMTKCNGSSAQRWSLRAQIAPRPSPAPTPTPAPTTTASGTRSADDQPFASNSIWNTAIGSNAQYSQANEARASKLIGGSLYMNSGGGYSISVNIASSSDPLASVRVSSPSGTFTHRIPVNATVSSGSDGNLDVISGQYLYEYWQLSKQSNTSYTANSGYKTDLLGSGINTGIRAANFSTLGGLIRAKEVSAGSIQHALVVAIPTNFAKHGWVWPAANEDWNGSSVYSGTIPMGTLFAIPASVNINTLGLNGNGLVLARAMQDYGVYVGDTVGQSTYSVLYAEPSVQAYNVSAYNNMSGNLNTLLKQLRTVTNSSSNSVGGGGTPRRPALPPPTVPAS